MRRASTGLLDVLVVAWVAAWIAMGLATAAEVRGLRELSGTLREVGVAVERSGGTLQQLSDIPFVGGELERPAGDVVRAGRSIRESGLTARESVSDLSLLLGVSIGVIPAVPVLAFYLPWRIRLARERRALRAAARLYGDDVAFQRYLALRAAHRRALHELRSHCSEPWEALAEREYGPLADAELEATGLAPLRERTGRRFTPVGRAGDRPSP